MQKTGNPAIAHPDEGSENYPAEVWALGHAVGVAVGVEEYTGNNLIRTVHQ